MQECPKGGYVEQNSKKSRTQMLEELGIKGEFSYIGGLVLAVPSAEHWTELYNQYGQVIAQREAVAQPAPDSDDGSGVVQE